MAVKYKRAGVPPVVIARQRAKVRQAQREYHAADRVLSRLQRRGRRSYSWDELKPWLAANARVFGATIKLCKLTGMMK